MTPTCKCHGVPMCWNPNGKYTAGGFWECRVKLNARKRRYYHRTGWITKRRRELQAQRKAVLSKLDLLKQEAEESCD